MDDTNEEPLLVRKMGRVVDWMNFESSVRSGSEATTDEYVLRLIEACLSHRAIIPARTMIYRARMMAPEQSYDAEPLPLTQMGARPADDKPWGRLGGAGLSCFYGAYTVDTAIAEMRPWRGARISVARFMSTIPLSILDLRDRALGADASDDAEWLGFVLGRPTHRDDPAAYLSTQRVAHHLRAKNVDGVLYDSAMHLGGTNVALFSYDSLMVSNPELYDVTAVSHEYVRLSPWGPPG